MKRSKMDLPKKIKDEVEEKTKDLPNDIKEEIYKRVLEKYRKSLVDVGEPVGLVSAQSISEPATQMILRSFHYVGMAELQLSLGLPRFIEIADARKKIKEKYMKIYLKDEFKKDSEKAYEIARKLKEVVLFDVVKELQVDIFNKIIKIYLDQDAIKNLGLSVEKVKGIIKKKIKRLEVLEEGEDYLVIKGKGNISVMEFYQYKERIKNIQLSGIKGIKDVLVTKENDEFVIYTYGSNLKEVLKIPEVDYKRVYTNDIYEVQEILGIEAAREVIVREILQILEKQGLDLDIRHILLLADILTWYGEYLGITRYGLQAEKSSALARAAFETPIAHFVKAALLGEDDELKSAIENIMTNQPIPFGTGLFKVYYKDEDSGN